MAAVERAICLVVAGRLPPSPRTRGFDRRLTSRAITVCRAGPSTFWLPTLTN